MTDKNQASLRDYYEKSASGHASSAAEDAPLANGAETDGQDAVSGEKRGSGFEDVLSFHSWDGGSSDQDRPADAGSDIPAPPGASPPAVREDDAGQEPALSSKEPPAESESGEKAREDAGDSDGKPMSLMDHLSELRARLTRVMIIVIMGFFACYAVSDVLFGELVKPLTASMPQGSKLIFTSLPEAFFVYMKVGFVASLFLTSPYTFYQIWAFVAPGLYQEERRNAVPLAFFSALFFLTGAAFCYFMVFPLAFQFFMSFATDDILPMPSLDEYLSFALKLLVAFGFIFEMPLFAFFLARIGVLTAAHLRRWRKYSILTSVIVGALLTPPDVPSQLIMASAILMLYEVSIWIMAVVGKRPVQADGKQDAGKAGDDAGNENSSAQETA